LRNEEKTEVWINKIFSRHYLKTELLDFTHPLIIRVEINKERLISTLKLICPLSTCENESQNLSKLLSAEPLVEELENF